ncbi:MAG: hypothetical protein H6865_07315 [Rhodospirillales bacterium]|nr:hypothetical protein [Alphaproteobacteria bacterium]MCB9987424.1 hypothetical protein [Rhodospirillales bacterium]USO07594.1 MAG: hypothetical protein H6866_09340 [Rhodospirillales bacterium]
MKTNTATQNPLTRKLGAAARNIQAIWSHTHAANAIAAPVSVSAGFSPKDIYCADRATD